jgi:STE24 endopeptidase
MNAELLFVLIIVFILTGFFLDRILSWLNVNNWRSDIPEEMKNYYDAEKYQRARDYERTGNNFSLISSSFSLLLILLMLLFNGFAFVDELARRWTENHYLLPLIYFGLLLIASDLLSLPFSIYNTFVIE